MSAGGLKVYSGRVVALRRSRCLCRAAHPRRSGQLIVRAKLAQSPRRTRRCAAAGTPARVRSRCDPTRFGTTPAPRRVARPGAAGRRGSTRTVFDRASRGSSATVSSAARPAANPSRKPIASARLARATGESVIVHQPVVGRADRRPVGLLPKSARSHAPRRSPPAADTVPSRRRPAATGPDPARCGRGPSGRGPARRAEPARRRRRRESPVANHAAAQAPPSACASRSSGISAHSSPASRTPSSHSSSRIADGPAVDQ